MAASSGAPLLITILLKCMNLSDEKYEIRNTIINIVSEILPVYNNCITVYHKSLMDWLTLEGYEEHAFVADVDDETRGGSSRFSDRCINRKCEVTIGTVGATERRRREHLGVSGGMLPQENFEI